MAFAVHQRGKIICEYSAKLRKFNSIFQADLYAINQALKWFTSSFDYVTLFSDSYSSILILKNFLPGNEIIKEIYSNLIDNSHKILNIGSIKAYISIEYNERTDKLAKDVLANNEAEVITSVKYLDL